MLRDNTAIPVFLFILSFPNPYQKKIHSYGILAESRISEYHSFTC